MTFSVVFALIAGPGGAGNRLCRELPLALTVPSAMLALVLLVLIRHNRRRGRDREARRPAR